IEELPSAAVERARLEGMLSQDQSAIEKECLENPLSKHVLHGLAYTVGSALGSDPPTREECFSAFTAVPGKSRLTAGAKALAKHAHRSGVGGGESAGWWGKQPTGPVVGINERAVLLFATVMDRATWRNLHWLPHQVLVYEVRVEGGYGMRWSQDRSRGGGETGGDDAGITRGVVDALPWMFRGFVEPMMDNGHEIGWRH
ncbi:hypothetical protein PAXRUDRAFT_61710, partial [Paxillus rubicundulus Ve08.2h10]